MKPPIIPEQPVPLLPDDALTKLLAACNGTEFENLRDEVVLRLFIDTGMRLSEMTGLTLDDIDLDARARRTIASDALRLGNRGSR